MSMIPLISIIVPVFNVEDYLHKCIDSILSQTFTNFELIIIDDGSWDNSDRICDEYAKKDSRITVIHQVNGGQSLARNAGIEIARGEYISFIDADDYIDPIMIETLYDLSIKYNTDISECGFITVLKDSEIPSEFGDGIEYGTGDYLLDKYIKADIFYGVVTKLFKKSLFDKTRFPIGRIYEDTWMTLNFCLEQLSYARTQRPLYFYYQRENSTLHAQVTPSRAREYIYILESQLELINNKINDPFLKKRLFQRIMEKSVVWYLGLALSDQKILHCIYSKLYFRRMDYSILNCMRSSNITYKNKISFILCSVGFAVVLRKVKQLIH